MGRHERAVLKNAGKYQVIKIAFIWLAPDSDLGRGRYFDRVLLRARGSSNGVK
jgi:hypothetical protein